MKKFYSIAVGIIVLLSGSNAMANSIGWHFSNGAFGNGSVLAASDAAGAPGYVQTTGTTA